MSGQAKSAQEHQNTLRWLAQVAGRYKLAVVGIALLDMVLGASSVAYALLFGNLVDRAAAGQMEPFLRAAAALAAMTLGQMLLNAADSLVSEWARASLENRFKQRLFACLLHKDYATVTARHSGDWVSRLTSDTAVVAGNIVDLLPRLAGRIVLVLTVSLRKILKRMHKRIQEAGAAVLAFVQERLESMMIVRVFSMEDETCAEAAARMERHKAARLKRNRFSNLFNFGFWGLAEGGYLLAALYCGYGILQGTVSYGTFTAVLQLVGQVQSPMAGITGVVPQYYAMIASAERLMEAEAYPDDGDASRLPAGEIARYYREEFCSLGIRDASFSYKVQEGAGRTAERLAVIDHLDLEIRKGEYVAFTGHSGCGKSTLLKLLMCLYPLDAGERYIQGVHGKTPLTPAWRGLFAYVPQECTLFDGTIGENIALGRPGATQEEVESAAKEAGIHSFIQNLPQGYATPVGEAGGQLSGGQRQRVAIARALLKGAPILLLDEATAALDSQTEREIQQCLDQVSAGRTTVTVAHRLSTIENAHRVLVMEEGRVVEEGAFHQLLEQPSGRFRALYKSQQRK